LTIKLSRRGFLKLGTLAGVSALVALETGCSPSPEIKPYENLDGIDIGEYLMGNVRITLSQAIISLAPTLDPVVLKINNREGFRSEILPRRTGLPNYYPGPGVVQDYPAGGPIVRVNNTDIAEWKSLWHDDNFPPRKVYDEFVITHPAIVKCRTDNPQKSWQTTEGKLKDDVINDRWIVLDTDVMAPAGFDGIYKRVHRTFYVYLGPKQIYGNNGVKFVDSENRELNTLPQLVKISKTPKGEYISQQDGEPIRDFGVVTVIKN